MFIFEYDATSTDRHDSHRQTCRQAHKYSIVVMMKCHLPLYLHIPKMHYELLDS